VLALLITPWYIFVDILEHVISYLVWFWYTFLSWMCYTLFMDDGSSPPRGEMMVVGGRCFMMLMSPSDLVWGVLHGPHVLDV
jgi:hypothetical protein